MRRVWRGVMALTAAGLIAINVMRLAGGLSTPPDRAILNPGACSQPCWHGIHPNATTLAQAEAILRTDKTLRINAYTGDTLCWQMQSDTFAQGCAYTFKNLGANNNWITIINLMPHENAFRLGDAVNIFGLPVAVEPSCLGINGNVYFSGNIIAVTPTGLTDFSPGTLVVYLSFVTTQTPWYNTRTPRWHGFDIYRDGKSPC
jgi:hypothetical protein